MRAAEWFVVEFDDFSHYTLAAVITVTVVADFLDLVISRQFPMSSPHVIVSHVERVTRAFPRKRVKWPSISSSTSTCH